MPLLHSAVSFPHHGLICLQRGIFSLAGADQRQCQRQCRQSSPFRACGACKPPPAVAYLVAAAQLRATWRRRSGLCAQEMEGRSGGRRDIGSTLCDNSLHVVWTRAATACQRIFCFFSLFRTAAAASTVLCTLPLRLWATFARAFITLCQI